MVLPLDIVYELRGLKKKENGNSETYVKLYILPDPLKQTKEKTKRIKERDPVFNETFQLYVTLKLMLTVGDI
jgi:hypothetical protein